MKPTKGGGFVQFVLTSGAIVTILKLVFDLWSQYQDQKKNEISQPAPPSGVAENQ